MSSLKDPEKKKAYDKKYREEHREKARAASKAWFVANREKILAKRAIYQANNKEKISSYSRKKWLEKREEVLQEKYRLTLLEYYILLEKQGYQCPICKRWLYPQKGDIHIDHCHETGKVRALLHNKCNLWLGRVENQDWMKPYLDYLAGYSL